MKPIALAFCLVVVGLLFFLIRKAGEADALETAPATLSAEQNIDRSVARVNSWLRQRWSAEGLEPASMADDLTVFRRLSLALHGTVPSLEEIHAFRSDSSNNRIERWLLKMLNDQRFPDYFSARLARVLTGVEDGQFILFRRDMLRAWLGRQLAQDRPWTDMTTELIAGNGLWTSNGATNFITGAFVEGEGLDENKLAGRTVRAFLGQRIDCAQCHDHPFDTWKQTDFEGLAAWFGQARTTPGGVIDIPREKNEPVEYMVVDPGEDEGRLVVPSVPFHTEWMTSNGSRRQQLASWIIHPDNQRYERAIANRIWGLMFGRAWWDPVDDLPHPPGPPTEEDASVAAVDKDLLDIIGGEFRKNGCRLHFLIRLIAESDAFRLSSEVPGADEDLYEHMGYEWARFPLVRLRPEQMIGSMFQAGSVRTIDQNSNLFVRIGRVTNENDFLKQYGDAADDELLQQTGTIPQALLRMNGQFTRSLTETGKQSAAGQIMSFSGDDEKIVDNCFLACLTRLPNSVEQAHFVSELRRLSVAPNQDSRVSGEATAHNPQPDNDEERTRAQIVRDLYWALFNSPGFSWNR